MEHRKISFSCNKNKNNGTMKHYQNWKRNRKGQQGQALTELVISLVGILIVISGFLLIAALGAENVSVSIKARENADARSRNGLLLTSSGSTIKTWSAGKDKLHFTKDDKASNVADSTADVFPEQLKDNEQQLYLTSNLYLKEIPANNNFALNLESSRLFLNAATLGHHSESEDNPLGKRKLDSLKELIRSLITKKEFHLEDTVFMPTHKPIEENE